MLDDDARSWQQPVEGFLLGCQRVMLGLSIRCLRISMQVQQAAQVAALLLQDPKAVEHLFAQPVTA